MGFSNSLSVVVSRSPLQYLSRASERRIEILDLDLEFIFRPVVVAIKHSNKIAATPGQGFVTSFCELISTGMWLKEIFYPAVLYAGYNIPGAIR